MPVPQQPSVDSLNPYPSGRIIMSNKYPYMSMSTTLAPGCLALSDSTVVPMPALIISAISLWPDEQSRAMPPESVRWDGTHPMGGMEMMATRLAPAESRPSRKAPAWDTMRDA
uniref:Uncharacterized protein n=1 Tax=Triticum urartu TaxID=4572 RepID=A0A8R7QMU2_TRIUA